MQKNKQGEKNLKFSYQNQKEIKPKKKKERRIRVYRAYFFGIPIFFAVGSLL